VDDLSGIAVPDLVFGSHPLRCWAVIRTEPLVLRGVRPPWNVA
jgi:hypothetical protein